MNERLLLALQQIKNKKQKEQVQNKQIQQPSTTGLPGMDTSNPAMLRQNEIFQNILQSHRIGGM